MFETSPLYALSPLDGRYASKVEALRPYFSEAALMRYRLKVEVEWFLFLCNDLKLKGTKKWNQAQVKFLRGLYEKFNLADAERVKAIEKTTNHDVKAIEYFLKERMRDGGWGDMMEKRGNNKKIKSGKSMKKSGGKGGFESCLEFVHFGCTSEDINNLSYGLMLKGAMGEVVSPAVKDVNVLLKKMAVKYKKTAMMARTHGQPATPTTLGKEFINVVARLERQFEIAGFENMTQQRRNSIVSSVATARNGGQFLGKMNGAVGNFNAHAVAYPKVKWIQASKKFIQSLGLTPNLYTTQIEPHDYNAELFDALRRVNTILMDFNRDMWTYISLGYFKQKLKKGEIGSSTMPHKVNPIDFENSEGNLGMANAFLSHLSEKLPISRLQRDLTDSTVLRNIGSALGYSLLAYKNCVQGLEKLELNAAALEEDLADAWELLAEPLQTVMRRYGVENAYEKLKTLTRGKSVNKKTVHQFIDTLELPAGEKKRLKSLTPSQYIGLAVELVDAYDAQS